MTYDELVKIAKKEYNELHGGKESLVFIGEATCGRSAGAESVETVIRQELKDHGIPGKIIEVGCIGLCYTEPIVMVTKPGQPGICYGDINIDKAVKIVHEYLINDNPLPEYALGTVGEGRVGTIPELWEIPVLKPQVRKVLANCGFIDPTNINHYLSINGYKAFMNALGMVPEKVIEEIKKSGLRGRGGAGFSTGTKWELMRKAKGSPKYIICNADEGDPGAFMDRSILEGDPHIVLEGMLIGAYAMGASKGFVYVRDEYPLAVKHVGIAIEQMREKGLLGKNIMGTDFCFDLEIYRGAGAFVCGEETALMASIEGKAGEPRSRPPYPAQSGLWGKPTNINNVKSWANTSLIMKNGADAFRSIGTHGSPGTMIFSLVGKVNRTGLIEVPMGITLRQMIFDIGGGVCDGKKFKAVQTGGPSGGCIPENLLDLQVDYDKLKEAGAIMGSGGIIVMDEETCMVDVAKYFLNFLKSESCGKCTPCREGLNQMHMIVSDITEGRGKMEDLDILEELANVLKEASLCALGGTAPNPVLTTLRYFKDEYKIHITEKKCPAKVCKALIKYTINPEKCTGCQMCAKKCPTGAAKGEKKALHTIDPEKCIKCGICKDTCKFNAVEVL